MSTSLERKTKEQLLELIENHLQGLKKYQLRLLIKEKLEMGYSP